MRRKKKKELNIFSMSALDLFASALGAFILLSLILIPYYENVTKGTPAKSPPKCPSPEKAKSCPLCPVIEPKKCPKILPPTEKTIVQDNMLLVSVEWFKFVDVDLVVYIPGNRKYYFGKLTYPGINANFIYDQYGKPFISSPSSGLPVQNTQPKLEVWRNFEPIPGEYRICAWLHKIHAENPVSATSVQFKLRLDKPTGPVDTGAMSFSHEGQEICPIKFTMSSNFELTMIP